MQRRSSPWEIEGGAEPRRLRPQGRKVVAERAGRQTGGPDASGSGRGHQRAGKTHHMVGTLSGEGDEGPEDGLGARNRARAAVRSERVRHLADRAVGRWLTGTRGCPSTGAAQASSTRLGEPAGHGLCCRLASRVRRAPTESDLEVVLGDELAAVATAVSAATGTTPPVTTGHTRGSTEVDAEVTGPGFVRRRALRRCPVFVVPADGPQTLGCLEVTRPAEVEDHGIWRPRRWGQPWRGSQGKARVRGLRGLVSSAVLKVPGLGSRPRPTERAMSTATVPRVELQHSPTACR